MRVEVGTLAPIDVVQAEAEAATRRQTLAQLEAQAQTAELALKRLIVVGHGRSALVGAAQPGGSADARPSSRIDSRRRCATRWPTAPTSIERKRNLEITDANLALLEEPDAARRQPGRPTTACQGIGGTRIIREGTGGAVIERFLADTRTRSDLIGGASTRRGPSRCSSAIRSAPTRRRRSTQRAPHRRSSRA